MSEMNIDAALAGNKGTLAPTAQKLVQMSNGCIC
jgi:G3E family GTPase